ncbi:MAG: hypothetical protein NVSMB2_10040 [Chloroflexota bacterium]
MGKVVAIDNQQWAFGGFRHGGGTIIADRYDLRASTRSDVIAPRLDTMPTFVRTMSA